MIFSSASNKEFALPTLLQRQEIFIKTGNERAKERVGRKSLKRAQSPCLNFKHFDHLFSRNRRLCRIQLQA